MMGPDAPDFGAASDGDGDRNMILGRGIYVTPSDSLAILAANAHLAPGYAARPRRGRALDADLAAPPTGSRRRSASAATRRRPAGSSSATCSMPARSTLCGEESFGTGSNHVREKDGLWAVLLWLNILAARREPVAEIVRDHWARFGRNYYSRHDYEEIDARGRRRISWRRCASACPAAAASASATSWSSTPTTSATTTRSTARSASSQGIRILFEGGARIVYRLSGTGTDGRDAARLSRGLRARSGPARPGPAGGASAADPDRRPARGDPRAHRPRRALGHHLIGPPSGGCGSAARG